MERFPIAGRRLGLALLVSVAGGAHALTYSWKPSVATYAPVTGTPLTFSSTDNGAVLLPLPFTFTYDSLAYNLVGVNSNGMLLMGGSSTSAWNSDLFGSISPFNVLAPWWDDLVDDATGTVQSFTEGTAPDRVFVIQYGDYPDYAFGSTLRLNWQVRLHEGSNRIQFVYGSKSGVNPSPNSSASVGIKGRNGLAGFYIAGTMGSRTVPNGLLNSGTGFPADGTVFTFAPDTAAPLGLTATPGSGSADLSWRPSRLTSLLRYRIWAGTSPTSMTPRDSTSGLNSTTLTLTGLADGITHYVGVTVVGPGLEESGFAQVVAVTPSQPPTVSIAAPASGSVFANTSTINFTATASDPDGTIARVEYYRGGSILIGQSTVGSAYSVNWFSPVAGTHSITARAYDNLGAMTTSTPINIEVNAAPTVSLAGPPTGTLLAPGSDVTLTAIASDADGSVARVEFLSGGMVLGSDATAPYSHTWTAVPTGRYTLTARAVDDRGATTVSTSSILNVTTPPTVAITSPAAGSLVHSAAGRITLSADAVDADGTVARVDFYRGTTNVGGSTVGNPYTVSATATSGTWTLTARATDNLGAVDTSAAVTFTVNLSPSVGLTAPAAGGYAFGGAIDLAASASDADGTVGLVEFFRDGVKIGEDNSSPYGLSWTPDTAGRYALTVRATDNAGGITTSATTWITLSRPPTVRLNSPADGFIRFPTDSLTAIASDPDGSVSRVDFYNGPTFLGSSTVSPYRIMWNLPSRGTFVLTAVAYDNSGVPSEPHSITVSAANVRITSPAPYSAFATHSSVAITARAWPLATTGSITRVDFYRDTVLIGSSTGPGPDFSATWNNVPPGRYRLQARAMDNLNSIAYSQSVTVFVNDSARALLGGRLFVTGHDADDHVNVDFLSAALDYLLFGKAAVAQDLPIKSGARIAFLGHQAFTPSIRDYGPATAIDVTRPGWDTLAFSSLPYDALIVGTGLDYLSAAASTAINAQRAKFEDYFNRGGGILALSEQGLGQSYYDFVPTFGSAQQQSLGSVEGVFTVTPAGLAIGLTEAIVDRDLTHTEFLNVDTSVFRIFEFYNGDGMPVSIGTNAVIDSGGGFIPQDSVVADPEAFARDSVFLDTLCIRFESPTPGAVLHLTRGGGNPDTSTWTLSNGSSVCIDNSALFRVIAKRTGWVSSAVREFRYRRSDQVAMPVPDVPAGHFQDRVCVRFTSSTAGAQVHYTLDGGRPDTSSLVKANGDSICLDTSRVISVLGRLAGMRDSDTASHAYTLMLQAAMPTLDKPDSTRFAGSLCFRFSAATPGSHIHYTLDGGEPDTAETHVHDGDSLCVDRSVTVRLMAERMNYIPSAENIYRYFRLDTVAAPLSNRPDSTWFRDTLCLVFTTATPEAAIHYTLDGSPPDSASPLAPSGSLCVDRTVRIQAVAVLRDWVNSPVSSYVYPRMDTLAPPTANPPGSTLFSGSLCVRFSTNADGATLRYSLDGTDPAGSTLTLPMSDSLCVDTTVTIRALAEKANWVPSPKVSFIYLLGQQVARPTASRGDSSWFADTLCVRFATSTDSATLHYLLGHGRADTSSLVIPAGQDLCVDRSVVVRVAATRPGWLPSEELALRFFKMDTAAAPTADPGDSTWFAGRQCIRLSTSTSGASIRYTLDGGDPALTGSSLASGDSVCVEDTATVRALARKPDWVDSRVAEFHYIRMQKLAPPVADQRDSTYFADSLCIRYSSATEGARIHLALDGGRADTSSLSIANGDTLCVDRSVHVEAVAVHKNWIPSEALALDFFRMQTVSTPVAGVPDSTWFRDSLCVPWTVATDGASIRVRQTRLDADGNPDGDPADPAGQALVSGDSVCLDHSATLRAVGSLTNWKDSPEAIRSYFRMDTVAKPIFDLRDTVFHPSICVKVSSPTPGAGIRYTLDGGDPDTSRMIKQGADTICTDRSVEIRAVGERKNSVSSEEAVLRLVKMPQVGPLVSSIGDSAVFARSICFTLSSATDSVRIRYTLGGGDPLDDTLSMASGDTLCLERSSQVVAVGTRPLWRNSPEIRISLEVDNEGPRLVKAEKIPYDIRNISVTGNCRGTGQDTLKVTFSERLFPKSKPPRWDRLLVFSPSCDTGGWLPVNPSRDPVLSGDGLTATILLDNASSDEKPKLGNCLSLDWRQKEFPDRVGNLPDKHGVRIEGRENPVRISQIRAYPPVVGLDDAQASGGSCTDERVQINTWIPPVGFNEERGAIDPSEIRNCRSDDREPSGSRSAIPPCLSIVEVVSDGPYVADIAIFDHLGNFVHGSKQQFGACGELDNLDRSVAGKKRSYLVWNSRDRNGDRVGNGAYVWRISFDSERNGKRGIQTVLLRTGYLRNGTCAD